MATAEVREIYKLFKFDHIKPVLRELHWLPVRKRIRYKLAMTVYKCLHGLTPAYLADDCLAISAPLLASDSYSPLAPGYCQKRKGTLFI